MVGSAFSLWRAIFLAHINRKTERNFEDARKFLKKVVRDNAIGYIDDVNLQTWSFGFYLNNARFRLRPIWKKLDLDSREVEWADDALPIDSGAQEEWTKCYDAPEHATKILKARLKPRLAARSTPQHQHTRTG